MPGSRAFFSKRVAALRYCSAFDRNRSVIGGFAELASAAWPTYTPMGVVHASIERTINCSVLRQVATSWEGFWGTCAEAQSNPASRTNRPNSSTSSSLSAFFGEVRVANVRNPRASRCSARSRPVAVESGKTPGRRWRASWARR